MIRGVFCVFLSILFIPSCAQFFPTDDYISKNRNKWTIEVPEVQELVHIIIALTPMGKEDRTIVLHDTEYYKNVIDHFQKFESHKAVDKVNKLLKSGRYSHLKMDACGFYFNENDKILKNNTYKRLNWSDKNYVESIVLELEDFSNKTRFREFYNVNRKYYEALVELMKVQVPIEKQWKWLEEKFPDRYDNYWITFSPLVNGSHSTNRFEGNKFKQAVMFVCGPITNNKWTETIKEGLMTRVVFTEIDHNYVNPVSDRFRDDIEKIFSDRSKWTDGKNSRNYGNALSVFNEYMTWSVFNLYALDTFNQYDFKTINEKVDLQMTDRRGFSKFKEFNQKLIEIYKDREAKQSIVDLYPLIIAWCKNQ
jgi:hypothetical protein